MGRMVDQTGLNERLRQHTRRSGMMVGLSMVLAVALTIGTFMWIFFRLDPFFSDFAGQVGAPRASAVPLGASPSARVAASPGATSGAPPTAAPTEQPAAAPTTAASAPQTPTATVSLVPTPTALAPPTPTATPAFVATHVLADYGLQVNLRAGPSTTAARIASLRPGTRLRFLGEEERAGDVVWMKFQTERGDEGWVRNLDITQLP